MEARRRLTTTTTTTSKPFNSMKVKLVEDENIQKGSDALPVFVYLTNALCFTVFFWVVYFLLSRWREKIRTSTPLHVVTFSEICAILGFIASFIYLLGFFGIDFVQSLILRPPTDVWTFDEEEDALFKSADRKLPCGQGLDCPISPIRLPSPIKHKVFDEMPQPKTPISTEEDEG